MKKILAFILSASMCLSLLSVLSPTFAYENNGEQITVMRMPDPDDDSEFEVIEGQNDCP